MNKDYVDQVITEYMNKIYGFALSKTMDMDQAEELASRIIFEVYTSLLKADNVYNLDGYIYRISSNITARFIMDELNERNLTNTEPPITSDEGQNKEEDYARLRGEISYLSNIQREIVVMYYFQKLRTKEIAKRVKLSQAKIKWHLFDARKQLKEGFKNNKRGTQKLKKSLFSSMRQCGMLSSINIDLSTYFSTSLSQNIAYSVYFNPKTTIEIANELSVPVVFVEDEVKNLLENKFMHKLPGNKYLTDIYITETKKEKEDKTNEVLSKFVKPICDLYIPLLFKTLTDAFMLSVPSLLRNDTSSSTFMGGGNDTPQHLINTTHLAKSLSTNFYIPENDLNFLMWSIISFAFLKKCYFEDNRNDLLKYMVKRKDGGQNITIVAIDEARGGIVTQASSSCNSKKYIDLFLGDASKNINPISVWQLSTRYGDKDEEPATTHYMLFESLYDFMTGKIVKDPKKIDKFTRLYDSGLIVSKNSPVSQGQNVIDYINLVVTTLTEKELIDLLPPIPDELKLLNKELGDELFKISKVHFPSHMRDLCRVMTQNVLTSGQVRMYILEYLLKKGVLKPLTKYQKMTVNTIMFSDVLPQTSLPTFMGGEN